MIRSNQISSGNIVDKSDMLISLIESNFITLPELSKTLKVRTRTIRGWINGKRIRQKHLLKIHNLWEYYQRLDKNNPQLIDTNSSKKFIRSSHKSIPWAP